MVRVTDLPVHGLGFGFPVTPSGRGGLVRGLAEAAAPSEPHVSRTSRAIAHLDWYENCAHERGSLASTDLVVVGDAVGSVPVGTPFQQTVTAARELSRLDGRTSAARSPIGGDGRRGEGLAHWSPAVGVVQASRGARDLQLVHLGNVRPDGSVDAAHPFELTSADATTPAVRTRSEHRWPFFSRTRTHEEQLTAHPRIARSDHRLLAVVSADQLFDLRRAPHQGAEGASLPARPLRRSSAVDGE